MDETEKELEAAFAEAHRKLKEYRDANRSAVLADVREKIAKYGITKSEVASAHEAEEEATRKPRASRAPCMDAACASGFLNV
jgi:DNA-binding protein H-NS